MSFDVSSVRSCVASVDIADREVVCRLVMELGRSGVVRERVEGKDDAESAARPFVHSFGGKAIGCSALPPRWLRQRFAIC